MITEKELDEMARRAIPGFEPVHHYRREAWKKQYRLGEKDIQARAELERKYGIDTGAAHMPPERVENGRQFQEEMIRKGFEKIVPDMELMANGGMRVTFDTDAAREHFQHVIALVANTATQRAYRQAIEHIETIIKMNGCEGSMYPAAITDIAINLNSTIELLRAYIRRLEAQFADLSEKIFGTDKPKSNEQTPQAGTV